MRLLCTSIAALLLAVVNPACAGTPDETDAIAPPSSRYVEEAARRFGIPEHWIWAVMRVESAGRVQARSSAGAMGLMQIMPGTWQGLRARHGLGSDPYDPRDNILAGAAYLREMHDRYGEYGMLAAYNAGPGRYEDYRSRGRPLPSETVAYVAKLMPMIGGQPATTQAMRQPIVAPTWTDASLFVVRASAAPRTLPDTAYAAPPRASASLFVAVSGPNPR